MHACQEHRSCIEKALHQAELICQHKGLRFTNIRRRVLEIIWGSHDPAKAYDILDKLRHEEASAQPPTVYRALDFLLQNGIIHKLKSLNSFVGCYHPLKHNQCYFLICGVCGEIQECCNSSLTQAIVGTANKNKFNPRHTTLEIEGQCKDCIGSNPA